MDLHQALATGVLDLGELLDHPVVDLDLCIERAQDVDHRFDHGAAVWSQITFESFEITGRTAPADAIAEAFKAGVDGTDDLGTGADETVPQLDPKEVLLGGRTAMLDGMEQLGIDPTEAGEHLCIEAIALAFVVIDGAQLACVGDGDLPVELLQEATDPGRMSADFHESLGFGETPSQLTQRRSIIGDLFFGDHLARLVGDTHVMFTIAQVDPDIDFFRAGFHQAV